MRVHRTSGKISLTNELQGVGPLVRTQGARGGQALKCVECMPELSGLKSQKMNSILSPRDVGVC